jgi:OmpA-OmpF porin, OOP family
VFVAFAWRSLSSPQWSRARPILFFALVWCGLGAGVVEAAPSWTLDSANSTLTYQSVKKNTVIETNKLRNLTGTITADGQASVAVDLNSVDSGIDIRDVRMRFLFFETFKFPTATVAAKLDPALFADLPSKRRMKFNLPFTLGLHGLTKDFRADVVVTWIGDGMVSVASDSPVEIKVEDFGLLAAITKLEQAGDVSNIVPIASVSFDFVFNADAGPKPKAAPARTVVAPMVTDDAKTAYSDDECVNRFETISRAGAIYFARGSAVLDPASKPLLAAALNVITKCPRLNVEISGHTDSDGPPAENLLLSQRRADAVVAYLRGAGAVADRLSAKGYGQTQPIALNDSDKNKALNRRIEFSASPTTN